MKTVLLLLALGLSYSFVFGQTEQFIAYVPVLGRIRGTRGTPYEDNGQPGKSFVQFRGIPYATVTKRFAPSTLLEKDLGNGDIFNATTVPPYCHQPFNPIEVLSENCLNINVYTHKVYDGNNTALRPVIFYVHGGAFTVGYGAFFGAGRLLNRDVVLVTFNYRLGLLGFFCLENEDVPGNAAMYDVVNALKWTKKYIQHFGGDPNLITIAGQSAGGVTVTDLMASPMTRNQGLFHRAIAASGSGLNAWATAVNPKQESLKVAAMAGCTNPNDIAVAECMRNADPMDLVQGLMEYQVSERRAGKLGFSVVSPVLQNFSTGAIEPFLPEHPRYVFGNRTAARVPLWMSTAKHDGSYVFGVFYNRFLKDNNLHENSTFLRTRLVPAILASLGIPDVPSGIHESLAEVYMGGDRHSGNVSIMFPGLIDVFSVFFFKGDTYKTASDHAHVAPTYWSSFDYHGTVSFWNQLFPNEPPPPFPGGVTHTDDMIYLFPITFLPFSPEDALVSTKMLSYWADFAKNGKPSVDWPELGREDAPFMSVDVQSQVMSNFKGTWIGPGNDTAPRSRIEL